MEASESAQPESVPILNYIEPAALGPGLVRIRRFNDPNEANLADLNLASHGITASVTGGLLIGYGSFAAETDLYVMSGDAEAATHILDEIDARIARRHAATKARLRCPYCGSAAHFSHGRRRLISGLLLIALGMLLPLTIYLPIAQNLFNLFDFLPLLIIAGGMVLLVLSVSQITCRKCRAIWTPPPEDDSYEEADINDERESSDHQDRIMDAD